MKDDDLEEAIAVARVVYDDGQLGYRLHLGTTDARGILASIRAHGYEVVRK